jgi:hypothetical protein
VRLTLKAITTETAAVTVQHSADITNDRRVQALLAAGGGSRPLSYNDSTGQYGGTSAPGGQGGQAQTLAQPAALKSGTYTFWPRIQGYQGAARAEAFIFKIVVRGDYMNIYLTKTAEGPTANSAPRPDFHTVALPINRIVLQDLDNPTKAYNPVTQYEFEDNNYYFPFKGVSGRRFSLTNTYANPPVVFEEIIIPDEPDE